MTGPRRIRSTPFVHEEKPLSFTFDGVAMQGLAGDTLASALLANDVHLVGRSFKYHRPRGVMSAGPEEANALVGVRRGPGRFEPNARATMQELYEGLSAESQNRWPSLRFDVGAASGLASRFLPAGFYYKTFMWPRWGWRRVYEPAIRRAAGLGKAPVDPDPDRYVNQYAHCDILIIGAGAAGLSAGIAAADAGARVIICDERARPGGGLLTEASDTIGDTTAREWGDQAISHLKTAENVTLLPRTTAFGYYGQNYVCLAERLTDHLAKPPDGAPRERLWQVRAKQIILCAGAIERPLLFPNNDRPGVMLSGAGRTYLNQFGVASGRRVVVATNNDAACRAALDLIEAGVEVAAIADMRTSPDGPATCALRDHGVTVYAGAALSGARGRTRVSAVTVAALNDDQRHETTIACDAVLTSGGWTPSVHLYSQAAGKLNWRDDVGAFVPEDTIEDFHCAGACRGVFSLFECVEDGARAALRALKALGFGSAATARPSAQPLAGSVDSPVVAATPASDAPYTNGMTFVDLQNDVTAKDIGLAVQEGFRSVEHVKRYTTNGMATDQGKTSNINGLAIAAQRQGLTAEAAGLTTFRPPYTPVTFGALAHAARDLGLDPVRRTAIDPWAAEQGAVFEDVGQWKRARYFPKEGETMLEAVARECAATRASAGLFDASTLGKIEVVGPDAAEFMNRMYTNPWKGLKPGRCRYGLMLGEDGFIYDDGVVGRIDEDRFHVTTTTGGAARVMAHMEDYLQTELPELDVWLTSTSEQWSVIALNGPNARRILEPLVDDIDLDKDVFPHMSVRLGHMLGVPIRLFRVSFTGELGFEVNAPAEYGLSIWTALMETGRAYNLTPYGTEAMHVMRAEKGYIIIGQDTDGTVTPNDAGMAWAVGKKKKDFVGKRSLSRPDIEATNRKQLVGLRMRKPSFVAEEGAQVLPAEGLGAPLGHVTSSYWSAALNRSIALALIEGGHETMGAAVRVTTDGAPVAAEICETVFYDKEGARVNA